MSVNLIILIDFKSLKNILSPSSSLQNLSCENEQRLLKFLLKSEIAFFGAAKKEIFISSVSRERAGRGWEREMNNGCRLKT